MKKIIVWLNWLSKTLKESSQTEFLIEKMQPLCLRTKAQKNLYRFLVTCLIGIIILPICILLSALLISTAHYVSILSTSSDCLDYLSLIKEQQRCLNNPPLLIWNKTVAASGVTISVSIGIAIGFFFKKIQPVETLKFPGSEVINAMKFAGLWERLLGILFANMRMPDGIKSASDQGFLLSLLSDWVNSLVRSIVGFFIPITAPIRGLLKGLRGPDIDLEKRDFPNQGIFRSAKNAVIFVLLFGTLGLFFGLIAGIIFDEALVRESELNQTVNVLALRYSLIGGLIAGMAGGLSSGIACIQHFALRIVLWKDKLIPWNYARFLNHATEWLLLQRIGGRYRFIHDLLREHFADM